jgi:hypothetical protein
MADKKISALPVASTPLAGSEVLPIVQGGTTDQVSVANLTAGRAVTMLSNTMVSASAVNDVDKTGGGSYAYRVRGNDQANVRFRFENTGGQIYELVGGNPGASNSGFCILDVTSSAKRLYITSTGDITANTGNLVIGTAGKGIDFSANTHAAGMTSELLNWYEEGTWTPVDASGAGLTFTTANTQYTRVGNVVTVTGVVTYPATVDVSAALIGGLPFTAKASSTGFFPGVNNASLSIVGNVAAGTTTFYLAQPETTNNRTNALMSGKLFAFSGSYLAA